MNLSNVSGIFHILIGGLVLAMVVALIDYAIKTRLHAKKWDIQAVSDFILVSFKDRRINRKLVVYGTSETAGS